MAVRAFTIRYRVTSHSGITGCSKWTTWARSVEHAESQFFMDPPEGFVKIVSVCGVA